MVDDFFRFPASHLPSVTDGDRLRWILTKNGDFTIRSYYHKFHGSSSIAFPWKGIWKVKAPRRVSFFVWTAAWNRILTGDNLSLRGFDFVDCCIMCHCCGETVGWWNWLGKHSSNIWNIVPLCLMWCIWKECNRQTFEDLDRSEDQLLALFAGSLFDWARAWGLTSSDSIPFFFSYILFCN